MIYIHVVFSNLVIVAIVVVLSNHLSRDLGQQFFGSADLLLSLLFGNNIFGTAPVLVSTLVLRPLPHNELVKLVHELLVADMMVQLLSRTSSLGFPQLLESVLMFAQLIVDEIQFFVSRARDSHPKVVFGKNFSIFILRGLFSGYLGDYLPSRGVVHNFIGEIELEVSDPVDIFVYFVCFFAFSFGYLLYFLEFRQHLVVDEGCTSRLGGYLVRYFGQFDPLGTHGTSEGPSELALELLIEGTANSLLRGFHVSLVIT